MPVRPHDGQVFRAARKESVVRKALVRVAVAVACATSGVAFGANTALFSGAATAAPSSDVIASTVPQITTTVAGSSVTNAVAQIALPPNVAPQTLTNLPDVPAPPRAAVGFVLAIKGDNLSQSNPDCAPPPSCVGTYWSGWDQVTNGACSGTTSGGWLSSYCY
jgi:hypothetical protein